ncbi:histidine kinase [Balneolales bacterium ANBcel1]|nr:histidine kinase [Balneolales bacterium ANBcel1]
MDRTSNPSATAPDPDSGAETVSGRNDAAPPGANYGQRVFGKAGPFLLINAGIALAVTAFICFSCFFEPGQTARLLSLFSLSFLMSSALSWGGDRVDRYFESRFSWLEQPVLRLLLTTLSYLAFVFVIGYVLLSLYVAVTEGQLIVIDYSWRMIFSDVLLTMGIALVIISIFIARSWLLQWRRSAVEAEQLRTELADARYRALVDQLNPHFLFNSLNTLSHLVHDDPEASDRFIRKLSQIYRYLLDVQHEELVTLERELAFAEDYLSLQSIRFGERLVYELNRPGEEIRRLLLPPLSLQLLLENAVKHNAASTGKPLRITVDTDHQELVVTNTRRPRSSPSGESRGVGLRNIKRRYALLTRREPRIEQTETEFRVALPLLHTGDS